ncbi:TetR/AcrR family transcriptional regulator [Humibacter antri]
MSETGLRETKKAQTRLHIARTALGLFLERGFERVSIAEIAQAAGVAKMTVFNYFPTKEDLYFEFTQGKNLPELGDAVRSRPEGATPLDAIHTLVRTDLERHAEWTGLHDGVARFSRIVFESPTLLAGYERLFQQVEAALTAALAEERGITAPLSDILNRLRERESLTVEEKRAALDSDYVQLRIAAAQILAAIQNLVAVNLLRQTLGQDAATTEARALAECDAAFVVLREGLAASGY